MSIVPMTQSLRHSHWELTPRAIPVLRAARGWSKSAFFRSPLLQAIAATTKPTKLGIERSAHGCPLVVGTVRGCWRMALIVDFLFLVPRRCTPNRGQHPSTKLHI